MYGNNPRKLFIKIKENNETKINVPPLEAGPRSVLNSLCRVRVILIQMKFNRDGISQNDEGIMIRQSRLLIQLIDRFQFEEGSKDENRFIIIFRLI